eukprot:INCI2490.1.p1 GENE.INCI2490.1~~INCI2490.1.p1  ORF type:complete len:465 (+),score=73.35 INCI2490.1:587-1981(+)
MTDSAQITTTSSSLSSSSLVERSESACSPAGGGGSSAVALPDEGDPQRANALSSFLEYLTANGLAKEDFTVDPKAFPRHFRVNPLFQADQDPKVARCGGLLQALTADFGKEPRLLNWFPKHCQVYELDASIKLTSSELFTRKEHGRWNPAIYGIDASSCAAVVALDPQPGDHVLDLCCAPGAKLCFLANYMKHCGTLTGVDLSADRLRRTWKMLVRYGVADATCTAHPDEMPSRSDRKVWHLRVFQGDGTAFALPPPLPSARPVVKSEDARVTNSTQRTNIGDDACGGAMLILDSQERATWAPRTRRSLKMNRALRASIERSMNRQQKQKQRPSAPVGDRRASTQSRVVGALLSEEDIGALAPDRKRARKSGAGAPQKLSSGEQLSSCPPHSTFPGLKYDRVLVDAECTHDGSVRHISKFSDWGWNTFSSRVLDKQRLEELPLLQRGLLLNGFRHVRQDGGVLV